VGGIGAAGALAWRCHQAQNPTKSRITQIFGDKPNVLFLMNVGRLPSRYCLHTDKIPALSTMAGSGRIAMD
jgi:hypothetical protein